MDRLRAERRLGVGSRGVEQEGYEVRGASLRPRGGKRRKTRLDFARGRRQINEA